MEMLGVFEPEDDDRGVILPYFASRRNASDTLFLQTLCEPAWESPRWNGRLSPTAILKTESLREPALLRPSAA
jgi:hypothetical protein